MRTLPILALVIGLALSACQGSPPPIGGNLPGGTWHDVSSAFNARVQRRFPIGSSEDDMLAELRRENFKTETYDKSVSRYQFSAVRELPGFPCKRFWTIQWNTDAGKITEIDGGYGGSCL
jgi:hypothetical protein